MSVDARAALEVSKEGRHFLELTAKCTDIDLSAALIDAGAKLLTVVAPGKENSHPAPTAPNVSSAFVTLKGLTFINPRGRFDLTFSKEALCLTNAKGSIIVPTTLLAHVAILDQIPQDAKKRCLVFLVLDRNGPAVMNGKQRLDVIIVQTLESDSLSVTSSGGEALEGPVAAVLCQAVGMAVPGFLNFTAPDPDLYRSARGHVAVPAVVKVSPGLLFPLPGAVLFAERPPLFVAHRDVLAVEVRRPQSATFDLVLHTRAPGGGRAGGRGEAGGSGSDTAAAVQQVEFSQIDRGELGRLQSYFAACKIKPYDPAAPPRPGAAALGEGGGGGGTSGAAAGGSGMDVDDEEDDEDEEDEDFDPSALEALEAGRRPIKRMRTGPSGSVAASNLPGGGGGGGAGPSGSRIVRIGTADEEVQGAGSDEDEEDANEDEDEDEDESYDEDEDELDDLTDEDDLTADDVRQRVRGTGGGGGGVLAGEGARGSRKAAVAAAAEEEEEEEADYDDSEEA